MDHYLLGVFVLLVPLMFWAAYHYYHDRDRPEPVANLLLCILLGVAAAYLNRGMYAGLGAVGLRYDALALARDSLPGLFAYAVLGIGLTEELAKLLPFILIVVRFKAFDEALDGIVYASFLALGFSLVENLHYLEFVSPGEALLRSFAGPLVHIVFASVWAYPVGLARVRGSTLWAAAIPWLAVSAVLHGGYDFVALGLEDEALVAAAAIVVAIWIWRLSVMRRLTRAQRRAGPRPPAA